MISYEQLHREVGEVQRLAKRHGTVTVILDNEGMLRILPGIAEVVGIYTREVERGQLLEDLSRG